MNFSQLRQRKHDRLARAGNNRGTPTIDDDARSFNYALELIGRVGRILDPSVEFWPSALGQRFRVQSASFGRRIHEPHYVLVCGRPLAGADGNPGMLAPAELESARPDFRTAEPGQPSMVAYFGNREIVFDRPFDQASVNKGGHFVSAWILPGVIATDGRYLRNGFPYSDGFGNGLGYGHGLGDGTSDDDDVTLLNRLEQESGGGGTGNGNIGLVTYTASASSCAETTGNAGDLAVGGGAISGAWPTPPNCASLGAGV